MKPRIVKLNHARVCVLWFPIPLSRILPCTLIPLPFLGQRLGNPPHDPLIFPPRARLGFCCLTIVVRNLSPPLGLSNHDTRCLWRPGWEELRSLALSNTTAWA